MCIRDRFYSIASAVVGGVSLFGGVGSIPGAFLGALLIAEVSNGMNVIGVSSYWQPLVIGVIILIGVLIDTNRRGFSIRRLLQHFMKPSGSATTPDSPAQGDKMLEHSTSVKDDQKTQPSLKEG